MPGGLTKSCSSPKLNGGHFLMEQSELNQTAVMNTDTSLSLAAETRAVVIPQGAGGGCGCGGGAAAAPNGTAQAAPSYVFALGRVEVRFPSLSIEKEFAQSIGRTDTAGMTDRQAMRAALSERGNRYLARQVCWILTIEGLETYILRP